MYDKNRGKGLCMFRMSYGIKRKQMNTAMENRILSKDAQSLLLHTLSINMKGRH